jgi:hypothetical protein
MNHFGKKM